eukprot:1320921-Amphidinium_carterae.1
MDHAESEQINVSCPLTQTEVHRQEINSTKRGVGPCEQKVQPEGGEGLFSNSHQEARHKTRNPSGRSYSKRGYDNRMRHAATRSWFEQCIAPENVHTGPSIDCMRRKNVRMPATSTPLALSNTDKDDAVGSDAQHARSQANN